MKAVLHGRAAVVAGRSVARQAGRLADIHFIENSPGVRHACTQSRDRRPAMKESIVIPIKIERLKLWTRWTLEATSWLICLGLLAASGAVAGLAALVWLISDSEVILTLGLGSGLLLGLAGVSHLLRQLDRAVKQLRRETPAVG